MVKLNLHSPSHSYLDAADVRHIPYLTSFSNFRATLLSQHCLQTCEINWAVDFLWNLNSRRCPASLPLSAWPQNLRKQSKKSAEFTENLQPRSSLISWTDYVYFLCFQQMPLLLAMARPLLKECNEVTLWMVSIVLILIIGTGHTCYYQWTWLSSDWSCLSCMQNLVW